MRIDIISSVLNGARFLSEFIESVQDQTHADWRLWLRDDGSTDGSADVLRAAASTDPRIHILHIGGPRLGVAAAYGWVLERIPADAAYVMCGDVDDVWLPHKIEHTLAAMIAAESAAPSGTPILVHSDLVVVDEKLRTLAPSFWALSGFDPEPATLRRLVVRNVATAPAVMLNGALRHLVGRTPAEALYQDWWYALVAAAFGRVIALREATVLYRQHGTNIVGAHADPTQSPRSLVVAMVHGLRSGTNYRRNFRRTAIQARALLDRYEQRLDARDREFLKMYSAIPDRGFFRRKLDVLRFRAPQEEGTLRMLGALLRG